MRDEEKAKEQLINELASLRRRIFELEVSEVRRRQDVDTSRGSRMWIPTATMFVLLMILVFLNEVLDLPYLMMGGTPSDVNLQEVFIEMVAVFTIGLYTVFKLIYDIRERSRLENELKTVNNSLTAAVCGFMITTAEGVITYVNPAFLKMFGYGDDSEVLSRNISELIISDQTNIKTIISKTKGETQERTARHKDGTNFPVEVSSSTVTDNKGNITGKIALIVDITHHKLTEEVLRKSEEIRGIFPESVG